MAISQAEKRIIATALKLVLKDYPTIKYSLTTHNGNLNFVITKGPKFLAPHSQYGNEYISHDHIDKHFKNNPKKLALVSLIDQCLYIGHAIYVPEDRQWGERVDVSWMVTFEIGDINPYEVV